MFCTHSMPMTHPLRCLRIEIFTFHWLDEIFCHFRVDPLGFYSVRLKDIRDWIHSTRQAFENFSCHSCIFNLCIIIERNHIDAPLLSKDISFSYESPICVSTEYSKMFTERNVLLCFSGNHLLWAAGLLCSRCHSMSVALGSDSMAWFWSTGWP